MAIQGTAFRLFSGAWEYQKKNEWNVRASSNDSCEDNLLILISSLIYNAYFIEVWAQLSPQSRMWMSSVSSLSKHTIWRELWEQTEREMFYTSTNVLAGATKERFEKKMFRKCDECIFLFLFTYLSRQFISLIYWYYIVIVVCKEKEENMHIDNKSSVCGTRGIIIDSDTVKYLESAGIKWTWLDVYSVVYIFLMVKFLLKSAFQICRFFLHARHLFCSYIICILTGVLCRGGSSRWTLTCCERQTNKLVHQRTP